MNTLEPIRARAPGRPRSFDRDRALDAAMAAFWERGYEATTYEHLEVATGCHRQSLVYAFGDKRALFIAALQRYIDRRVGAVCAGLEEPGDPSRAISGAFALWLEDASRKASRGCMAVNVAGELGGREPDIAKLIESARRRLVSAFAEAFKRAADAGSLAGNADPRHLAELAVAVGDGALLHARNTRSAQAARRTFSVFLGAIFK